MKELIGAAIIGGIISYLTARMMIKRFIKMLNEIECRHRQELLEIAKEHYKQTVTKSQ